MKHTSLQEERYLHSATNWQQKPKKAESGLGGEIFSYLEQHNREFERNSVIADLWSAIVPQALAPYCRLDKRSGNVLYIQAWPGPYMHQVRVLSNELLEKLKAAAPRCGIHKIKVIPMQDIETEER